MLREYRINALIIVLLIAAAHALPESTKYTNDDEWQEAVMAQDMVARGTDSAYDEIWFRIALESKMSIDHFAGLFKG